MGWPTKKLGEVCEIVRGVTFNKADASYVARVGCTPILRAGNIQNELELDDDLVWVSDRLVDKLQVLRMGDIAMCMSSGSPTVVGKTASLRREWRGSVGAFCGIIRPKSKVVPGYVAAWFRSPQFIEWRNEQTRGVNIQNLRASQVAQLEIPLPPLDEQRRIVGRLDAQMKEVEKMRAAVDARIAAARALPSSFLRTVFNSPESQTWPMKKLGEIAPLVDGDWILAENYQRDGVRLLQVGDVGIGGFVGKSSRYISQIRAKELKCTMLELGDVLISRMPDPIGRACVLPELPCPAITAVDVSIWRPPLERVDRKFAVYYFTRSDWFDVVSAQASGATRQRVSRKKLEQLTMPVPSIAVQRRIVAQLDEQMVHANALTRALESEREAIAALPAALLREVFG